MNQGRRRDKQTTNRLWIARKRAGYPLKWVALLLGHRSISPVSEYEHGRSLPNLRTALKLQCIYGTPLAELFPQFLREIAEEVQEAKERNAVVRKHDEKRKEIARQLAGNTHGEELGRSVPAATHLICGSPQTRESSPSPPVPSTSAWPSSRGRNSFGLA